MQCFTLCFIGFAAVIGTSLADANKDTTTDLLPGEGSCGQPLAQNALQDKFAQFRKFPWTVRLAYEKPNGKGFHCGGVLISPKYVLSSAICVKGKDLPKNWKLSSVRLGQYNRIADQDCVEDSSGQHCIVPPIDVEIEEYIVHEGYNPNNVNQANDIALIRLAKEVVFTDYIQPICLSTTPDLLGLDYTGSNLIVAGWNLRGGNGDKLIAKVTARSNSNCSSAYSERKVSISAVHICAGGPAGNSACNATSGDGLVTVQPNSNGSASWYLVGILSFGPARCGSENLPDVFARVSEYVPWILSKLKQ